MIGHQLHERGGASLMGLSEKQVYGGFHTSHTVSMIPAMPGPGLLLSSVIGRL